MKFLRQIPVKYGLIQTAITALCLLLMELTGQNEGFDQKSPIFPVVMMITPFVVWYLGLREKKMQLKGNLPFKQGVIEGFKISLVYGIVSPFVFLFYYLFVNPPILEYVRTSYGLTGADYSVVIGVDMLVQFVASLVFGTVYAAIIMIFLRSKSK